MINTQIIDPETGRAAIVSKHRALHVAQEIPDVPPIGTVSRHRFYNAVLGSTGADSGTTNMNVDGSGTAQEFYIRSHADYDLYLEILVIIIADTTVAHNTFGGVGALGTGWDLKLTEDRADTFIINKAKTGGQVIAQGGFAHAYGADATSFKLTKWTANDDATTVIIPMHHIVPGGLRIGRGTMDQVTSVVRDNLEGLTEFTVRALGRRHYP